MLISKDKVLKPEVNDQEEIISHKTTADNLNPDSLLNIKKKDSVALKRFKENMLQSYNQLSKRAMKLLYNDIGFNINYKET